MTTTTDGRAAFLMQLRGASNGLGYAAKEFDKQRADLARRAMQTAENPSLRSAMTDLAFVAAYLNSGRGEDAFRHRDREAEGLALPRPRGVRADRR